MKHILAVLVLVIGIASVSRTSTQITADQILLGTCLMNANGQVSINTACVVSVQTAMSINVCQLTSIGVATFTCTMTWAKAQNLPTWFWLTPDVTPTGNASLSVDSLGSNPLNIKKKDGTTDPGNNPGPATLIAGQPALLYYDGKVFRQMI